MILSDLVEGAWMNERLGLILAFSNSLLGKEERRVISGFLCLLPTRQADKLDEFHYPFASCEVTNAEAF